MPTLHFDIRIAAPREHVWRTTLYSPTYERWTATFSEGSHYEGSWEAGTPIRFLGPDGGGMVAEIAEHRPDEAAVEHTFVNTNPTATLKLGQARGIALLVPARRGLPVAEYAPNAVKKAIVGAGHAEKGQIRVMVKVLMPKATFESDDAADALAIALTHAHHRGSATARLARAVAEAS